MSYTAIVKPTFYVLIFSLLMSCSLEQKIAMKFVTKENKGAVLVLPPDIVYKTNLKDSLVKANESLNQIEIDSILLDNSLFIKHLNEDAIISLSLDQLKNELSKIGFAVYDENSVDQFILTGDSSFILKLAQAEIEEGYGGRVQHHVLDGENVDVTIDVNFVNINSWFELVRQNVTDEVFPLLYSSFSLADNVNGYFDGGSGRFKYYFTIDSLSLKDFIELPEILGKKICRIFLRLCFKHTYIGSIACR